MLQIYDLQHVIHNPDCIADNVFTILLINKGNGGCLINYDSYPLGENTAFCIYPGKFRSVKADYNVRGQVVFFSTEFLFGLRENIILLHDLRLFMPHKVRHISISDGMDEMEVLLLNLEKEYNSNAELKAEISSSLLRLLLLQLARKVVTGDTMEQYRSDVLLVRDFINLIDTHFMSEKKVAAYARKLSIDPNYLNIKVKRITGHTASYHIQQRILLEAKHKMSSDGMNLKQIAYYLGYEDTSHFSKFFKKSEGATFTEFKNIV